jgi:hypothetical protein
MRKIVHLVDLSHVEKLTLRRTCGPEREEVIEGGRRAHNEDSHDNVLTKHTLLIRSQRSHKVDEMSGACRKKGRLQK